jgi:sporulation-control protein spo0M
MKMKTIYTTLFTLILTINVVAQKDYHKYSLYFNAGLPFQTNFDFKPTIGS